MNQVLTADAAPEVNPPPPQPPAIDPTAGLAKNAKVRDLMSPPVGVYRGHLTVAETTEALREAFSLQEDMPLEDALKAALARHYPVYPIVDANGTLAGLVRGETLFAN